MRKKKRPPKYYPNLRPGIRLTANAPLLQELGLVNPQPTNKVGLTCSFCNKPVQEVTLTRGTGPLEKFYKLEEVWQDGKLIEIARKPVHFTEKVIACPDCVLLIKPQMRKIRDEAGEVIGEELVKNNIRFPETDG